MAGRGRHQGLAKPPTFNFLGFTHYIGRSRRGSFVVGRKTQRERMAKKLKAFGERLKRLRSAGGKAMMLYARQHLRGHLAYYAVSGNSRSLRQYFRHYVSDAQCNKSMPYNAIHHNHPSPPVPPPRP